MWPWSGVLISMPEYLHERRQVTHVQHLPMGPHLTRGQVLLDMWSEGAYLHISRLPTDHWIDQGRRALRVNATTLRESRVTM